MHHIVTFTRREVPKAVSCAHLARLGQLLHLDSSLAVFTTSCHKVKVNSDKSEVGVAQPSFTEIKAQCICNLATLDKMKL